MENKKVYVLMQQYDYENFRVIGVFFTRDDAYNEMCDMMDNYDYEQLKFDCGEDDDFIDHYDYFLSDDEHASWVCTFEIHESELRRVNNMKLYINKRDNIILNENKLRAYLLQHECEDLSENSDKFISGRFDFDEQLDIIKNVKYGQITAIIKVLNVSWGYAIEELDIPNDLSVYMSVRIIQACHLHKNHIIVDLFSKEIENLIYLYYEGGYHTKNMSMLDSVNEFIDDHWAYIMNKLESNGIVE